MLHLLACSRFSSCRICFSLPFPIRIGQLRLVAMDRVTAFVLLWLLPALGADVGAEKDVSLSKSDGMPVFEILFVVIFLLTSSTCWLLGAHAGSKKPVVDKRNAECDQQDTDAFLTQSPTTKVNFFGAQ